jgi:hypothetical protein
VRDLVRMGASAIVVVGTMLVGALVLWIGIPLAWLWIASQIQVATDSLGAAVGAAMLGVVLSIAAVVPALGWLSGKYRELREARGLEDTGNFMLEVVMVTSAGIAIVLFSAWFFLFSGSSPIPLNLSY